MVSEVKYLRLSSLAYTQVETAPTYKNSCTCVCKVARAHTGNMSWPVMVPGSSCISTEHFEDEVGSRISLFPTLLAFPIIVEVANVLGVYLKIPRRVSWTLSGSPNGPLCSSKHQGSRKLRVIHGSYGSLVQLPGKCIWRNNFEAVAKLVSCRHPGAC